LDGQLGWRLLAIKEMVGKEQRNATISVWLSRETDWKEEIISQHKQP